jgi:hypothetical protein
MARFWKTRMVLGNKFNWFIETDINTINNLFSWNYNLLRCKNETVSTLFLKYCEAFENVYSKCSLFNRHQFIRRKRLLQKYYSPENNKCANYSQVFLKEREMGRKIEFLNINYWRFIKHFGVPHLPTFISLFFLRLHS